jgi:hypothetical protein
MTIWQKIGDERSVFQGKCTNIDLDNERIMFECNEDLSFVEEEIFFYSKENKMIFKAIDFNFQETFLDMKFPEEFISLSTAENEKYAEKSNRVKGTTEHFKDETMSTDSEREKITTKSMSGKVGAQANLGGQMSGSIKTEKISSRMTANLSTDKISTKQSVKTIDEDKAFEHQRAAPRARPKVQKRVTLHIKGRPETSQEYDLFDLSMGGMSFVITSKDLLQKNDELELTYFDAKPIETLMIGIIRNIREEEPDRFRVGVQFISEE